MGLLFLFCNLLLQSNSVASQVVIHPISTVILYTPSSLCYIYIEPKIEFKLFYRKNKKIMVYNESSSECLFFSAKGDKKNFFYQSPFFSWYQRNCTQSAKYRWQ